MPYYEDPQMNRSWSTGERGFSHYQMEWGTVVEGQKDPDARDGWDAWFRVRFDGGDTNLMNAERFMTHKLASRYGYGADPKQCFCESSLCNGCPENPCTYPADERFAINYIGQACTTCVANLCASGGADHVVLLPDEDRSTSGVGFPD